MQAKTFGYLVELSQCRSFYQAAKNLGISQQGLSKAISSLEAELGTTLVERTPAGIRLTRKGELALHHAREINSQYNQLMQQLLNEQVPEAEPQKRITVHVSYYSAQIASADIEYVHMLTKNLIYMEEPFDKLLRYAELSDGTDLVFADIHEHTLAQIRTNKNLRFEPLICTKYGFLWKEGSSLAAESQLHRETVARHPVALNTARETAQIVSRIFAQIPLQDVRLGSSSQRLLLEYVQMSEDTPCLCDSFGFYLSRTYHESGLENLHFTPLATPAARAYLGFILPANVSISPEARGVIDTLRRYLQLKCPDYLQEHPFSI